MKKIMFVMLAMVICFTFMNQSFADDDLTIFGITLGKSLKELGISECKYKLYGGAGFEGKIYDRSNDNCFKMDTFSKGTVCYPQLNLSLSFHTEIHLDTPNNCDLNSPIEEIQVTFNSTNYNNMLVLLTNKFGPPKKIEEAVVQNKMGAKYNQEKCRWSIKGHSIVLYNMYDKINEGFLLIRNPSKIQKALEKNMKKLDSDTKKF